MRFFATLKKRKRRFFKSLLLGLGASAILSLASYLGWMDIFEAKALDVLMQVRGEQKTAGVVLIKIDDAAFEKLGEKQPLPRGYLAGLIDIAARGGAKIVAVDIELKIPTERDEDELLLNTIQKAEQNGPTKFVGVFVVRPDKEDERGRLYRRSPFFDARLNTLAGFANATIDSDGLVRHMPLAVRGSDGKLLPSLGLAIVARYAGYDLDALEQSLRGDPISLQLPQWDRLRGKLLPQNRPFDFTLGDIWKINYAGAQGSFTALPSDPLAQLAKLNVPLAADNPFRDKIVLIGASFQDSRDFFSTPYGLMSGLEIHANIIHTILTRSEIRPTQRMWALALLTGFGVITSLFLTLLSPTLVTILSLVAIPVLLIPLSYLAFAYLGLWVDFVTPLIAMRWGSTAAEYVEARHVRKSLGHYVGWEVANQIVAQDESLNGQRREVTVFFTDVRNFTTLCEGLPPEAVVARMNELFAMMGKVIATHNGCILDFIGDAVLAIFGAPKNNPQHAQAAVQTAIAVQARLAELNQQWQQQGLAPLEIGVGIHTGAVVVGIVGTGERKKFDVTGDTVNIGSRVEGLNKELGTTVLATRETVDKLDGRFAVRDCGPRAVKGREQPVEVFEVLTSNSQPPPSEVKL